jgi:hypothetical protein
MKQNAVQHVKTQPFTRMNKQKWTQTFKSTENSNLIQIIYKKSQKSAKTYSKKSKKMLNLNNLKRKINQWLKIKDTAP